MKAVEATSSITDPVNLAILGVSEDRIAGFHPDPIVEIANQCGVDIPTVVERLRAMLAAGTIRRIRQTLITTNLAPGALVAWALPEHRIHAAFDAMFQHDPFSGHVVVRSTDPGTPGSRYRLWTTLKVPQGYSLERHAEHLAALTGATAWRLMPARRMFVLGVGHTRRRSLSPGEKAPVHAEAREPVVLSLDALEWRVLTALKREFTAEEIVPDPWRSRAREADVSLETFCKVAASLSERGVIGRFSTFLEHVKPLADGQRVTRYNALFHWAVPAGQEIAAGGEVGRHHIMTHCYWREGGAEFNNVNIMGVAHGMDKAWLLAHKAAIDTHLQSSGITVSYTSVFWGGRSEIKPSEISPLEYERWCRSRGIDPESSRPPPARME